MSDEEIDTNIDNYSVDDIMEMLNLPNNPTEYQVKDSANKIIAKLKTEDNMPLVDFFQQALTKVLKSLLGDDDNNDINDINDNNNSKNEQFDETKQLGNWWKNEYPAQSNKNQTDKYTTRKNTTQIFQDNNHFQMNKEKLGVNQHYQLPVVQDELNPNLKNTITRLVSLDSQYRQNILPYLGGDSNSPSYNTDFTVNLSDQLNRVINMKLYSVQIPTTWYTFDESLGNLCFDYISGTTKKTISISSGNYTINELKTAIFTDISNNNIFDLSLNIVNPEKGGLFQFINTGGNSINLVFYSEGGFTDCNGRGCGPGSKINQNLGWNLGFRIEPDVNGNVFVSIPSGNGKVNANVPPDVYGPKYFMLIVDDYNHNHLNNGLVNINDTVSKLSLPTYYNPDKNLKNVVCSGGISFLTATSPRTLTQAQIYSANEIIANRKKNSNRTTGPTNSDVMALIPLRGISSLRPEPYIEFGVNLQSNERTYFGPVDIDRLRIKLVDDKGNVVNLHDHDWSFTLTIEQMYQY